MFLSLIFSLYSFSSYSQLYNKEVVADIKVEDKGEFLTFSATAENITATDFNLRYEFFLIKKDPNNNSSRTSQGNRFFLEAFKKEILSSTTVNKSEEGTVIVLLLIYDEDDKPIGKDRIELVNDLESIQEIIAEERQVAPISNEEAKPQDGFEINGLVIKNTITKVGRDFFRYFYSEYYNKEIVSPKNIEIDEIPGRGRVTKITVKIGQQVLLSFFARPNKEYLKQMAAVSIQRTIAYIQQLEKQGNNFKYY
jgi:hypothetical protein